MDAIGLPTCQDHRNEADTYYEMRFGEPIEQDTFEYCDDHGDMWESGCPRCESCSEFHYGMSVDESEPQRTITVYYLE